jgi:hypothetical protein
VTSDNTEVVMSHIDKQELNENNHQPSTLNSLTNQIIIVISKINKKNLDGKDRI